MAILDDLDQFRSALLDAGWVEQPRFAAQPQTAPLLPSPSQSQTPSMQQPARFTQQLPARPQVASSPSLPRTVASRIKPPRRPAAAPMDTAPEGFGRARGSGEGAGFPDSGGRGDWQWQAALQNLNNLARPRFAIPSQGRPGSHAPLKPGGHISPATPQSTLTRARGAPSSAERSRTSPKRSCSRRSPSPTPPSLQNEDVLYSWKQNAATQVPESPGAGGTWSARVVEAAA